MADSANVLFSIVFTLDYVVLFLALFYFVIRATVVDLASVRFPHVKLWLFRNNRRMLQGHSFSKATDPPNRQTMFYPFSCFLPISKLLRSF